MIEKVIDILVDYTILEKNNITEQSKLVIDLGLSSLDVINVVVAFEEEFDIEIPDQKIKELNTVGDIVEYIEQNV
ncbi:acyl carrier protein [Jutongia hominis]|uniref:Acyl carrier protein n=1 Tax=Jutongia hominis TaxID=2763664 RepID=A0ABR7MRL6_9FIRM|nr:acyl carrier protein [Jutongia hominis]MBC8556440.1 acyl carrier protein [Jutongia hominis]